MGEEGKLPTDLKVAVESGVQLKKVETKGPRLPTAEEIEAAKKQAAEEPEPVPAAFLPKDGGGKTVLDLVKDAPQLKKTETKEPRLPTAEELEAARKLAEQEPEPVPKELLPKAEGKTVLDLVKDAPQLKKVETKEPRLPTAEELEAAKKQAEREPEPIPKEFLPKAEGKTVLDLVKDAPQLKKVETKEPRLPTAAEIEAAKKQAEHEPEPIPKEFLPKAEGKTVLDLVRDGKVELKKVETKEPRLPTAEEIAAAKEAEGKKE